MLRVGGDLSEKAMIQNMAGHFPYGNFVFFCLVFGLLYVLYKPVGS